MKATAAEKQTLYAISRSGKKLPVQLDVTEGTDIIAASQAILKQNSFTDSDQDGMILSYDAPAALAAPTPRKRIVVASPNKLGDGPYPPIPQPANKDDHTPSRSEQVLVSMTAVQPLYVYLTKSKIYVPSSGKNAYCSPSFPKAVSLAYYRYWRNDGSRTIVGPQTYNLTIERTEGMSVTNEQTLSGELGVEVGGLSAKLTATTSESITVTEEKKVSEQYGIDVPAGQVCVYTLWQLVEVFTFLDNTDPDRPLKWDGKWGPTKGLTTFAADFPTNLAENADPTYVSDPVYFPA
jgi:hypothetical protein